MSKKMTISTPINKEDKYFDFGNISLKEANEMNIPVHCYLFEPDEDKYWHWSASNYMPRKEMVNEGEYEIKAETKEDILKAIKKYVIPLYEIALKRLSEDGELYYWE